MEAIQFILKYLSLKDILNISLVCKKCRIIAYPLFLRAISVVTSKNPVCLPFRPHFAKLVKNPKICLEILARAKKFMDPTQPVSVCCYDKLYEVNLHLIPNTDVIELEGRCDMDPFLSFEECICCIIDCTKFKPSQGKTQDILDEAIIDYLNFFLKMTETIKNVKLNYQYEMYSGEDDVILKNVVVKRAV